MNTKLAFSINEAVEVSGRSRTMVYEALKHGRLVARKDGRRTIILADDLRAWLEALPRYVPQTPAAEQSEAA